MQIHNQERGVPMFDIQEGFKREISVAFSKADGTPGTVQGFPSWTASDEALALVVPAADGMSAMVLHQGGVGDVTVTMTADGDLGIGVFQISATEVFSMLPPLGAVAGKIAVGPEVKI